MRAYPQPPYPEDSFNPTSYRVISAGDLSHRPLRKSISPRRGSGWATFFGLIFVAGSIIGASIFGLGYYERHLAGPGSFLGNEPQPDHPDRPDRPDETLPAAPEPVAVSVSIGAAPHANPPPSAIPTVVTTAATASVPIDVDPPTTIELDDNPSAPMAKRPTSKRPRQVRVRVRATPPPAPATRPATPTVPSATAPNAPLEDLPDERGSTRGSPAAPAPAPAPVPASTVIADDSRQ